MSNGKNFGKRLTVAENDIDWIKKHLKTQTRILVAIFLSVITGLGALLASGFELTVSQAIIFISTIFKYA